MDNILTIKDLSKCYYTLSGEVKAIDNISLEVKEGDFVAIVGASGCGKSTLLNILDGIDKDYEGNFVLAKGKSIGYMLQRDALLPWLSIEDNCNLGCKIKGNDNKKEIDRLLKKYELDSFRNKKPSCLSGGMRQRASLIRTLGLNVDLLLLDEPFSALDYQTKLKVENDIYKIIKNEGKSAIMVTHDVGSAIAMANKVVVLSKRPSKVKKIYDIDLGDSDNVMKKRCDERFSYYLDMIWKDLEDDV